jgi:hypothetical protein
MVPILRTALLTRALAEYRAADAAYDDAINADDLDATVEASQRLNLARRVLASALDQAERISVLSAELQDSLNGGQ